MNVKQVAEHFGVSESTIRRRIRERKDGEGSFPVPVFGFNRVARWRRFDIENWSETEPEIIAIETSAQVSRRVKAARSGLAALGYKVPKGNESNN